MACQNLDRNVLSKVSGMFQKMITLFIWKAGKGREGGKRRIPHTHQVKDKYRVKKGKV